MDWGRLLHRFDGWRSGAVDVLARGNEMLDRAEVFLKGFQREQPAAEVTTGCGGYLGDLGGGRGLASGIKHYNYAGEEISFWEAMELSQDPFHYQPAYVELETAWGPARVSTICPGFDMGLNFYPDAPIKQFETMAFGEDTNPFDQFQHRATCLEEALAVHNAAADQLAQSWWTNLGGRA